MTGYQYKAETDGAGGLRSALSGVVLDGRYEISSLIGQGGMGSVYKARHLQLGREVAVKVLHRHLTYSADSIERFRREALTASSLNDPNIISIYGFGVWNSQPYMVMEYLEGTCLADLVAKEGRLTKEKALPIFAQICDALSHAHSKGVLHRDLKPGNVMLMGPELTVKLVDFGLARMLPESGKELQRLTQTDQVVGTALYMSPEQCMGKPLDARSDIYAMGCLIYEVLTGRLPLTGNTTQEILISHVSGVPKSSEFLSDSIRLAIFSALNKDPEQRPQSALQLKEALFKPEPTDQQAVVIKHPAGQRQPATYSKALVGLALMLSVIGLLFVRFRYHPDVKEAPPDDSEVIPDSFNSCMSMGQYCYDQPLAVSSGRQSDVSSKRRTAVRCFRKALMLAMKAKNVPTEISARQKLSQALSRVGQFNDSEMVAREGLKCFKGQPATFNNLYFDLLLSVASAANCQHDYTEATSWYEKAVNYHHTTGTRTCMLTIAFAHLQLGEIYGFHLHSRKSKPHLQTAVTLFQQLNEISLVQHSKAELAEIRDNELTNQ